MGRKLNKCYVVYTRNSFRSNTTESKKCYASTYTDYQIKQNL